MRIMPESVISPMKSWPFCIPPAHRRTPAHCRWEPGDGFQLAIGMQNVYVLHHSAQGRIQGFGSSMPPPPGSGSTGGRMMAFGSNTGGVPTGGWGPSGASSSYSSSAAPAPAANNRGGFMGNSVSAAVQRGATCNASRVKHSPV
jgi:hypothetical protein